VAVEDLLRESERALESEETEKEKERAVRSERRRGQ